MMKRKRLQQKVVLEDWVNLDLEKGYESKDSGNGEGEEERVVVVEDGY